MPVRRQRVLATTLVALVTLAYAVAVVTAAGPHLVERAVDLLGQALAAGIGSAGSALGARRAWRADHVRLARAWALVGLGTFGWCVGSLCWSWFELVPRVPVPFPSVADVGFLLLPVLAGLGLLVWPSGRREGARGRSATLLDASTIGASLLTVAWATSLEATWQNAGGHVAGLLVAMAYPVGDVLMLTLLLVLLGRAPQGGRAALGLLTAGISSIAVSDLYFLYFTRNGTFGSGDVPDIGWVLGFGLVGLASFWSPTTARRGSVPPIPSLVRVVVPYVPVLLAVGTATTTVMRGQVLPRVTALLATVVVVLVLLRQFLALLENRALLVRVRAREHELAHLAFHDPLTGLANRALLGERLEEPRLAAPGERALLVVDLDGFKAVNDLNGHAAGDAVLVGVARVLRACVREQDLVVRLGGDEFAVLLEGGGDADDVTARLAAALAEDVRVAGTHTPVRASIGAARWRTGGAVSVEDVLAEADRRMYLAKATARAGAPASAEITQDRPEALITVVADARGSGRTEVAQP